MPRLMLGLQPWGLTRESPMLEPAGLVLFVQVIVMDVIGLLLDLYLWWKGGPTITSIARQYPVIGILILIMQLIGFGGLLFHFYVTG